MYVKMSTVPVPFSWPWQQFPSQDPGPAANQTVIIGTEKD